VPDPDRRADELQLQLLGANVFRVIVVGSVLFVAACGYVMAH
jgi:hypothetical protein